MFTTATDRQILKIALPLIFSNLSVPLVVRLAGTNYKEGKKILDDSGLKILSANDLNDAAKKIVEAIK